MTDLTTAQRLAAYRDELRAAGFYPHQVDEFVQTVAPSLVEDLEVQADFDDEPSSIGEVRVRLVPLVDCDDVERVVERVAARVQSAADGEA